ncbi:MAG: hypothetical protein JOZ62_15020 [Acidobacteriaceae bacterium]|nr:hypothetical protein [Acidobacteriaceae bacterium]
MAQFLYVAQRFKPGLDPIRKNVQCGASPVLSSMNLTGQWKPSGVITNRQTLSPQAAV